MSVRWMDGFDHYGTTPSGGRPTMLAGAWAEFSPTGAPQVSNVQSRTSGFSLNIPQRTLGSSTDSFARRQLGASLLQVGFAAGVYMANLPTNNGGLGIRFADGANAPTVTFCFQSDGSIQAYYGAGGGQNGTLLGTSGQALTAQAWNHVEVFVSHHASAGSVEVRVNGITVLSVGGVNTGSMPSATVRIGNTNTGAAGTYYRDIPNHYWDDLVCWDTEGSRNNTFVGPQKVVLNKVAAATAQADWTVVGAATSAEAISEIPPDGDSSYIQASAAGSTSDFTVEPLDENVISISAVYLPVMMRQSQPGSTWVQQSIISDGEAALGADRPITEAYTFWGDVIEVDPKTGANWTRESYNASLRRFVKTI